MKKLFCVKLAAYLCMKQSPSASVELALTKRPSSVVWNDENDHPTGESKKVQWMRKELKDIRDLLESRIHREQEERCEDDRENAMRNVWILAAAVLDRICAMTFTGVFVGGTLFFFTLFFIHPFFIHP